LDDGVYRILKRIAMNSLPKHRQVILKSLWDAYVMSSVWETSKSIGKMINAPTETTKRYCEDLWMLNLLSRKIEGEDSEEDDSWKRSRIPYNWQLSDFCISLIEESEIYLNESINPNEERTPQNT
jgi:hypothetical protein